MLALDQAEIVALLRDSIGHAFQKARGEARRAASAANVRSLLVAIHMWANEHRGVFPPNLRALVKAELVEPETLTNPARPELGRNGYVYLPPGVSLNELDHSDRHVLLYEAHERFGEGVNVGFADGHVEWVRDQARLSSLMKESQSEARSRAASQPEAQ